MAGGYQPPAAPAPVSGPAQFARRTDGGPADPKQAMRALPDAAYGEQATFRDIQSGAPMSASAEASAPQVSVTPFGAPTERPDEPVTAGAPFGAGPGPEALGPGVAGVMDDDLKRIATYLPALESAAEAGDAPKSFRMFVNYLKGFAQ